MPADGCRAIVLLNDRGEITASTRAAQVLCPQLQPGVKIQTLLAALPWDELLRGRQRRFEGLSALADASGAPRQLQVMAERLNGSLGALVALEVRTAPRTEASGASERRYRSVYENSLDGVLLTVPTGEILAANLAACQLLGRTEDELRRIGRAGVIDPADARLRPLLEERQRRGHARGELTMVRKDGTRFEAEISSSIFFEAEGVERTSMIIRDITQRRRAEQALRFIAEAGQELGRSLDYEATLQALVRLVVPRIACLCFVDLLVEGAIRRVAVAHRDPKREAEVRRYRTGTVGLTASRGVERVIRAGETELIPVVDDAWLRSATRGEAHFQSVRALGLRSVLMVPLQQQEQTIGALILGRSATMPSFQAEDIPLARGIADRAALAIENARLYAAAVQAKRLRDEVLGIVSHDLRAPLAAIRLNAQLVQRRHPDRRLDALIRTSDRANRLIGDLLTAATIEAHAIPLERKSEPLREVLAEVVELHKSLADEKQVSLRYELAPEVSTIDCDRHRLVQLLRNLVNNAIKFTASGGRVEIRGVVEGGQLRLSVIDSGAGIPEDEMEHLFDRYWQGARARRAGAGLGLTIVKGIAEAHGWTLEVKSEPGRGSVFSVLVPLPQPGAELHPAP